MKRELTSDQLAKHCARSARWRAAHREELRRYYANYRKEHGLGTYYANYYQKNKARWKKPSTAKPRLTAEELKLRKQECDRRYRARNRDRLNAGIARAKAAKPEKYKTIQAQSWLTRRARLKAAPIERVALADVMARDRMRCHLCGLAIERRPSFDHLIPVSRGGAHAEWNLMLAHIRCNQSRGTKPLLAPETKEQAERYIASRVAQTIVATPAVFA